MAEYPSDPWAKKIAMAIDGKTTFRTGGPEKQREQLEILAEGMGDDPEENRRVMAENYQSMGGTMPVEPPGPESLSDLDLINLAEGRYDQLTDDAVAYLETLSDEDLVALSELQGMASGTPQEGAQQAGAPMPMAEGGGPVEAAQRAQQELIDQMGTGQRFLVGVGKSVNDVVKGIQQVFTTGEEAEALEREIKAERETWDMLDKQQVGWEDVGQVVGDAGMMLMGGPAAASLKGGVMLTAAIEGAKATVDEESRLARAGVGAGSAALGGLGGKVLGLGGRNAPVMPKTAGQEQIYRTNGLIEMAVGGLGRMMSTRDGNSLILRGANQMLKKHQAYSQAASKRVVSGPALAQIKAAKTEALTAARQKELNELGAKALEQAKGVINNLNSRGRGQVVLNEAQDTIESMMKEAVEVMPNGQAGLRVGEFVARMSSFSNKQLKEAYGENYSKQIRYLVENLQEEAGKIKDPAEITAEVFGFVDNLVRDGVDLSKMPKEVRMSVIDWAKMQGRGVLRAQSNARTAAATAAGVDVAQGAQGIEGLGQ